jgi:hypothetical protein
VKQAEDQDCQHSNANRCVQPISFQRESNYGKDYTRDRRCNQQQDSGLNDGRRIAAGGPRE